MTVYPMTVTWLFLYT